MGVTGGAGTMASGYHFGLTVVQWASLVEQELRFWLPFSLTVVQWASLMEQELRLLVTIWFNSSTMGVTGGAGTTASGYHLA
jgi:hypothetical protein